MRNILRTGRPTKLVHRRNRDTRISNKSSDLQGQNPGRKVMWSVWQCWHISRERKVPETAKLVVRLPMPRTIMHTGFNVKRSKIKVIRPITVETESVSYLPNGKAIRTSKLVCQWSMRYQLPQSAIKACEDEFSHAGGGIPCRPHPAATQLVSFVLFSVALWSWPLTVAFWQGLHKSW